MRALCCPDKYRGSLSAAEAAGHMAAGVRAAGLEGRELPLADGGEGTLDVLVAALGGRYETARVTGPLGEELDAAWAVLDDGTAVVETARAAGLALVRARNDPVRATTAGVGQLLGRAAAAGVERALVCLGGSATTDGGRGAVEALGWSLRGMEVVVLCDVQTTFCDAAVVFSPQKGATREQVALLTRRLEQVAADYRRRTGVDVVELPGSGAAGGLAGGLAALGAVLRPGFDVVAEAVGLDAALRSADVVLTGEGRLDMTSFGGKVVGGVIFRLPEQTACAVIAGHVTGEARRALPPRASVISLAERAGSIGAAIARSAELLKDAADDAARSFLRS